MKLLWITTFHDYSDEEDGEPPFEAVLSASICEDEVADNLFSIYENYARENELSTPTIHMIDYDGPVPCTILVPRGTLMSGQKILNGEAEFVDYVAAAYYPGKIRVVVAKYIPSDMLMFSHYYLCVPDKIYGGISLTAALPNEAWHHPEYDTFVWGNSFKEALTNGFKIQRERLKNKV